MNVVVLVPVILGPGTTVLDDERRRIGDSTLCHHRYHVLKERSDRVRMLTATVPVDCFREILFEIEAAFERWCDVLLACRHQNPLPLHSLPDHVLLEGVRLVEVGVARQD